LAQGGVDVLGSDFEGGGSGGVQPGGLGEEAEDAGVALAGFGEQVDGGGGENVAIQACTRDVPVEVRGDLFAGSVWQEKMELILGILFTSFLFYRTFFRRNSPIRNRKIRRRIGLEIIGVAFAWIAILTAVTFFDVWTYFLCIFALPAIIAGNLQSWRKYIEHVGLTGDTVNSSTRNIVPRTRLGRALAFTLLHEPYHGVHHQQSGLPHALLPRHVDDLEPRTPHELPPFPSYWSALQHLLQNLKDPRVGAQWRTIPPR
jgi:fatty acid desaturase